MDASEIAKLHLLVFSHVDIFKAGLSSSSPAKLPSLKIDVLSICHAFAGASPELLSKQKKILEGVVSKLIDAGMVYSNATSPCAPAPTLVL